MNIFERGEDRYKGHFIFLKYIFDVIIAAQRKTTTKTINHAVPVRN
jgi:hypothetical protein